MQDALDGVGEAPGRATHRLAGAGVGPEDLAQGRQRVRDHGRAGRQGLQGRQSEGLDGPGGQDDVRAGEQGGHPVAVADEPQERDREPVGPLLEVGPKGSVTGHQEPHPVTAPDQLRDRVQGQRGALLPRQAAGQQHQHLVVPGMRPAQAAVAGQGVEVLQVDPERDRRQVRDAQPPELLRRPRRGADHRVVRRGERAVAAVGEGVQRQPGRQPLAQQPVQALVADHQGRDAPPGGPPAQAAQGRAVVHLEPVGLQALQHVGDLAGAGQHAVAGARHERGPQRDHLAPRHIGDAVVRSGQDLDDLVARGGVPLGQLHQRRPQAARGRGDEVGALHDARHAATTSP